MRDIRDAIRHWARTPIITAVVVLSLALGIGANTAIFSLIDALMLRSLPVRAPEQLVRVQEPGFRTHGIPVWEQIRNGPPLFEATAVMTLLRPDISPTAERRSAQGLGVSGNFFEMLGVTPAIGRLLTEDDDRAGAPAVAVTDYEFWQSAYGGRPEILGAVLTLDGRPFTIVGVAEQGFFGLNVGRRFDIAISLNGYRGLYPEAFGSIRNSFVIVGRLQAGQSAAAAESTLRVLQPRFRANLQIPDNRPFLKEPWSLVPIASGLSGMARDSFARPLSVLMALVALVLAMACTNVALVLLARGAARHGQLAVRLALGASRWRVVRSLMAESLVIAAAGAAAAILVGTWSAQAIVNAVTVNQSGPLAAWISVPLDVRVFLFTLTTGVAATVAFGVGPALWSTRVAPLDAIKEHGRGSARGPGRFGQLLVMLQVALAFMLVFGGTVLVRSFVAMTTQDLGFDARRIIVAVPDFSRARVARSERIDIAERVRARVAAMAGVDGAALVESTPFGLGTALVPLTIPGSEVTGSSSALNFAGAGYFETMDMTLLAGRTFDEYPREPGHSAIVNDTFARRYFGGESPLGRVIHLQIPGRERVEIVGVVADARFDALRGSVLPLLYVPFTPQDETWTELTIRSQLPESSVKALVLEAIGGLAPGASVEFRTIEDGIRDTAARDRTVALLAGGLGLLALLLSGLGLYGVMAQQVEQRRRELGVRIALGAAPRSVIALIIRHAAWMIGIGVAVGLAVALASGRLIAGLLFDVTPADPVSIAAAILFLSTVTVLAGLIPARRAARVDPMVALRED